jgi:hypothetical protein
MKHFSMCLIISSLLHFRIRATDVTTSMDKLIDDVVFVNLLKIGYDRTAPEGTAHDTSKLHISLHKQENHIIYNTTLHQY